MFIVNFMAIIFLSIVGFLAYSEHVENLKELEVKRLANEVSLIEKQKQPCTGNLTLPSSYLLLTYSGV